MDNKFQMLSSKNCMEKFTKKKARAAAWSSVREYAIGLMQREEMEQPPSDSEDEAQDMGGVVEWAVRNFTPIIDYFESIYQIEYAMLWFELD